MRWMLAAFLCAAPAEDPEVRAWVFFSPESPDASGLFRELRGVPTSAVLLAERYTGGREPGADFLSTLRVSGEVLVVDAEGLARAERWGIRELPAVAVVRGGRVHVAAGTRADVKELLSCSR